MIKSLYLVIIAAVAAVSVRAADDVSVVGAYTTPLGPITPDISVVGWHPASVADGETPDVSVVGGWTATTTGNAAAATQTECYRVEAGGVTSSVTAEATVTNGVNPPGYHCFLVYATGGGTVHLPLPDSQSAPSQPNLAITIGLPVIVSVVGLAAIIGAILLLMRLRARRAAAGKRTWVDRPGGWAADNASGKMESGTARY